MFIMSYTIYPRIALPVKNIERLFIHQEHEKIFEVFAETPTKNYKMGEFKTFEEADEYFHNIFCQINEFAEKTQL